MSYQPSIGPVQAELTTVIAKREHRARGIYARGGKRVFDLVFALILVLPVGSVVAVLAAIVALDGANPFFGHQRIGRNGRSFRCWKLRTMVPDAEKQLSQHLSANEDVAREWAEKQKLTQDPRVTRIGRVLRQTSLDELPQIWNVLKGEMSLVGPRPVTQAELERYGRAQADYMSVRPGITGLWQVRGRNQLSYIERIQLDEEYSRNSSLLLDLSAILRTIPAVIKLTGK